MYCLEHTFRDASVCRIMEINVAVHEKPICSTIYTPINNTLQLSCQWKRVDLDDGAQLMIRNRLFAGKIITTQTSDTNLTSVISTMVSIKDVLSDNNIPNRCLVSRNEMNATCNFSIYMKPKEEIFTSDSLMFKCCSTRGNEPQISFYDISGNPWPSSSTGTFVIHEKPPSVCDTKSPTTLICANETYDGIIVHGLAKLFLPTQSRILTSISHVSEHEMVETGHCENIFNIDVRPFPPMLMTTPSTANKLNASNVRNMRCQEEHSIAHTLKTVNQTSNSRTVHPERCLDEKHTITRELHIGGCLSVSVHSDQALTGTRKISIRKTVGSDILISCYLFHGTCFKSNRRLGAMIYDNGTIKVSLSHAKVEDSGEYVFEIRADNTILCKIASVNISVFDMLEHVAPWLEREPTCSNRIHKNSRNLHFNCEWLQNDTYTGRAHLMIENRTTYHYRTRWKRDNRNQCFTKKRQMIAAVNLEFLFSGIFFLHTVVKCFIMTAF